MLSDLAIRESGHSALTDETRPLHVLTPEPGAARSMSAMAMLRQPTTAMTALLH